MTPYARVMDRKDVSEEVKAMLKKEHEGLSPLVLKREIDRRQKLLFTYLQRHALPAAQEALR